MIEDKPLTTPVLLMIFNRPETTQRVFDEIRKAKPSKLFVSADGPRDGKVGETERCQAARDIIKQVDWECEVHTNFRDKNVGLKIAVSSGIVWFFESAEEGIILEDDCLPTQSFFWFCQKLLERYRDDERIMMISGDNFQLGRKRGDASYYFSKLGQIWGWASWRRAWQYFDASLETFPIFKDQNKIVDVFEDKTSQRFWMTKIQAIYNGGNAWAFAWVYAILTQNGLCICPNVNLVSNIGFGSGAVHAKDPNSRFANVKGVEMECIVHPTFIIPDKDADQYLSRKLTSEQLRPKNPFDTMKGVVRSIMGEKHYGKLRSLVLHRKQASS